jgi:hypothetical protein
MGVHTPADARTGPAGAVSPGTAERADEGDETEAVVDGAEKDP